jgi:hypothetical protein
MPNLKNVPVIYTELKHDGNGQPYEQKFDAWLEGIQGDTSAMIRIEGNPYRVPARKLTHLDGSPIIV